MHWARADGYADDIRCESNNGCFGRSARSELDGAAEGTGRCTRRRCRRGGGRSWGKREAEVRTAGRRRRASTWSERRGWKERRCCGRGRSFSNVVGCLLCLVVWFGMRARAEDWAEK